MSYKINYNLKGGSGNANIIWNNNDDIVLNKNLANQTTAKIGIDYKYYTCKPLLDQFVCTNLDTKPDDGKVNKWAYDKVNLNWLNNGINGMTNCGNTCYFNSYMQCILFTYPLIYHIKLIIQSNMGTNNIFEILVNRKFENNDKIEMSTYIARFATENAVSIGQQQDSMEYFKNFMNYLEKTFIIDNKTILDKYFYETINYYPDNYIYYDPRKRGGIDNKMNLIKYYFEFLMTTEKNLSLLAQDSNKPDNIKTYTTDPFQDLQLNIYGSSLVDCLNEYFKEESLLGDARINLDSEYLGYEFDTNKIKFITLPKILCISLKRFKYDGVGKKINTLVDIPYLITKDMLLKYMWNNEDGYMNPLYDYDLYAFSYHIGDNDKSGHYASYINKPKFENTQYNKFLPGWYRADDPSFTKVDNKSEIDSQKNLGYIYFYKARDSDEDFHHHIGNKDIKFKYN